jgi:hypothetical protein
MSRRINLETPIIPDPKLCAWFEANGIDVHTVPVNQEVLVEDGNLTFIEFEVDEDGIKLTDEGGWERGYRKRLRTVPLLSAPEDHNI